MPSTLGRNLNLCFHKIIRSSAPDSPRMHPIPSPDDHSHPLPNATSSSILIKNFNSLYDHTLDYYSTSKSLSHSSSTTSTASTSFDPVPADFAIAFASQRFFFSSPGRSNSIIESTNITDNIERTTSSSMAASTPIVTRNNSNSNTDGKLFNDSVAVPTYSPDPYADFRRSMQEMVEARAELMDVKTNWELLHDLLLCYLELNPKNTHKFILGAFADLLVSLMSSQPTEAAGR